MTYRVLSEAKPCFDFTTEDEEIANDTALRVAVITGRTTKVIEIEVCMTCTTEITEANPRTNDGITCAFCDTILGDEEPTQEPSAEQERAWDEQYDGTSLGS